jgi:hypothetical protein
MRVLLLGVALLAGCAAQAVDRHRTQPFADSHAFSLFPLQLSGVREGALATREPMRMPPVRDAVALQARLNSAFARQLSTQLRLDAGAPLTIVPTLTLDDPADFAGLAPETTDTVLDVQLIDGSGRIVDDVILRAPADAPLARASSRDARLERAVRQLADRYATHLAR